MLEAEVLQVELGLEIRLGSRAFEQENIERGDGCSPRGCFAIECIQARLVYAHCLGLIGEIQQYVQG